MSEKEVFQNDSTYVIDAENAAEMARVMAQARHIGADMGELFPAHLDLSSVHQVLDIACGPGQWVLDVAQHYPHMQVTGVDISQLMIAYATSLVKDLPKANAYFRIMDIRESLDFPDQSFDVIQARFLTAFMHVSAWSKLLSECRRVLKPGGTICLIEGENFGLSNSGSLELYNSLMVGAMRLAGHCFAPEGNMFGITALMPRLLQEQNLQNIRQNAYALNFSAGRPANGPWFTNCKTGMKLLQPFLLQWGVATQQELNILYERALLDIQSPDFCGQAFYLAVSGEKLL
jgi:ubiquinone/menaquinone biosynthesis C-methylase UbiE